MGFFGKALSGIARFGHHVGSAVHRFGHIGAGVARKFGQGVGVATKVGHAIDRTLGGALTKTPVGATAFGVLDKVPHYANKAVNVLDRASGYGQQVAQAAKGGMG